MEGSPATLARFLTTLPQADDQEKAEGTQKKEENTHILKHKSHYQPHNFICI